MLRLNCRNDLLNRFKNACSRVFLSACQGFVSEYSIVSLWIVWKVLIIVCCISICCFIIIFFTYFFLLRLNKIHSKIQVFYGWYFMIIRIFQKSVYFLPRRYTFPVTIAVILFYTFSAMFVVKSVAVVDRHTTCCSADWQLRVIISLETDVYYTLRTIFDPFLYCLLGTFSGRQTYYA